jgi:hypothetical protein
MRLRLLALGLFTALMFLLPLNAADDKKKDPPLPPPIDAEKLPAGDYNGKLLTTPGSDGTFTVQIDFQHYEPKNPSQLSTKEAQLQAKIQVAQQKIVNYQTQLVNATKQKDIAKYTKELNTETATLQKLMAESQIKPSDLKLVTDTKVFDMKLTDTADIRYIHLPMVFDDDGKPKKYTDAELKELKGKKTKLPGYEGKLDDLKINQTITVTLVHIPPKPKDPAKDTPDTKKDDVKPDDPKKDDPKKPDDVKKPDEVKKDDPKKDDPKKDDPKDPADKPPPEKKMQVKMIVIQQDAPDDSTDSKGKKKKNN